MVSRIYLTNEFKCCALTRTLVRGRKKRLFPHTAYWTCTSRVDSVKCGFYQGTTLEKSGVMPCWLVQGCMVCFSLPDLGRFHPHPQSESMSKHVNKY